MKNLLNYLTIACLITVGVFLWPGALAAVTGFTIFGFSLAAIAGPSIIYQFAAIAGAALIGLYAIDWTGKLIFDLVKDTIKGAFSWIKSGIFSSSKNHDDAPSPSNQQQPPAYSYNMMGNTMPPSQNGQAVSPPPPPYQSQPPFPHLQQLNQQYPQMQPGYYGYAPQTPPSSEPTYPKL